MKKNENGCWNCKWNFYQECEFYHERIFDTSKGASKCDFEGWVEAND